MLIFYDKHSQTERYEYDCNEMCNESTNHCFECDYNFDRSKCRFSHSEMLVSTCKIGEMFSDFISLDFDNIIREVTKIVTKNIKSEDEVSKINLYRLIGTYLNSLHPFFGLNLDCSGSFLSTSISAEAFQYLLDDDKQALYKRITFIFDPIIAINKIVLECCKNPDFYSIYLRTKKDLFHYNFDISEVTGGFPSYKALDESDLIRPEEFSANIVDTIYKLDSKSPCIPNQNIIYLAETITSACAICLHIIYSNNYQIKYCNNCNQIFVISQTDNRSEYCRRKSPQNSNKTCREYMTYIKHLEKTKSDEATRLYKQIYNIKRNRFERCKNKVFEDDFSSFKLFSKQWKADIKAGFKTEEEFIAWLKEVKEKKVL